MRLGLRRTLAATALAVQAAALFIPRTPQVDSGGLPLDKLAHLLLFAVATATVIWAGARVWPTVILMTAYAAASEVIQGAFYAQRTGDAWDALSDALGVAIGAIIGARLASRTAASDAPS
jgi:VanZ family protein